MGNWCGLSYLCFVIKYRIKQGTMGLSILPGKTRNNYQRDVTECHRHPPSVPQRDVTRPIRLTCVSEWEARDFACLRPR